MTRIRRPALRRGSVPALAVVVLLSAGNLGPTMPASASRRSVRAESGLSAASAPAAGDLWLLESADQFRLGRPPGKKSRKTARELDRLISMQKRRTRAIRKRIRYWNTGPATRRWTEIALDMTLKYKQRPAPAARILALLQTGLADAVEAASDSRASYRRIPPARLDSRLRPLLKAGGTTYPPHQAVVAGAAQTLLADLFPNEPPGDLKALADEAAHSRLWAGVNYPSDVKRGLRLGREVAALFVERGSVDGHDSTDFSGERPPGEEYWEPTPPGNEPPQGGPVGTWLPWAMSSPDQARAASGIPGPFAYGSPEFMDETREVMAVADAATPEQQDIARFWDDGVGTYTPAGHWNQIALSHARAEKSRTRKTARLLANVSAAAYDAVIASFEAKYHWWSIRPITTIRRLCDGGERLCSKAELDPAEGGDPSLATHPDWQAFLMTPPFPSYPAGHATISGATSAVLAAFFPDASDVFTAMGEEAAMSRLWGGIHFRRDNDHGLVLGRAVAELVLQRNH